MSTQLTLRQVVDQTKDYWQTCCQILQSGEPLESSKDSILGKSTSLILDAQQAISAELQRAPEGAIADVFRTHVTDVCNNIAKIEGIFDSNPFPKEFLFAPFVAKLKADVSALCLKRNFTAADAAEFQRLSNQLTVVHPLRERFWSVAEYSAVRTQLASVHPHLVKAYGPSIVNQLMPQALRATKAVLNVIDRIPLLPKFGVLLYGFYSGQTKLSIAGTIVVGCQLLSKSSVFATPKPISLPPTFDTPAAAPTSSGAAQSQSLPPMITVPSAPRAPEIPQPNAKGTLTPNDFLKDGRSRKTVSVVVQAASFLGEFFGNPNVNAGLINTAQRNGALMYYTALGTSQPLAEKVRNCSFISFADLKRQSDNELFKKVTLADSCPKPAVLNTYTEALQGMRTDATAQRKPVGILLTKGESSLAITCRVNQQRNVEIGVFDPATSSFYQFDTIDSAAKHIERLCAGMPSAQNEVGLAKASKALPVDPVSLDPIPEDRQITVNHQVVDIVGFASYLVKTWQKPRGRGNNTFQDYNNADISPNDIKNLLRQIAAYYHISICELFCGLVELPRNGRLRAQINTLRTDLQPARDAARLDFLVGANVLNSLYAADQRPAQFFAAVDASRNCPRDRKQALRDLTPARQNAAPAPAPVDIPPGLVDNWGGAVPIRGPLNPYGFDPMNPYDDPMNAIAPLVNAVAHFAARNQRAFFDNDDD